MQASNEAERCRTVEEEEANDGRCAISQCELTLIPSDVHSLPVGSRSQTRVDKVLKYNFSESS